VTFRDATTVGKKKEKRKKGKRKNALRVQLVA
jgi:hypothetical protein